jgi:hypothetical protein
MMQFLDQNPPRPPHKHVSLQKTGTPLPPLPPLPSTDSLPQYLLLMYRTPPPPPKGASSPLLNLHNSGHPPLSNPATCPSVYTHPSHLTLSQTSPSHSSDNAVTSPSSTSRPSSPTHPSCLFFPFSSPPSRTLLPSPPFANLHPSIYTHPSLLWTSHTAPVTTHLPLPLTCTRQFPLTSSSTPPPNTSQAPPQCNAYMQVSHGLA